MSLMDLPSLLGVLAKEIGKGGGGSTEEPTVCFALLPIGLGLLWVGLRAMRRGILNAAWRKDGRSAPRGAERKVQTA